MTTRSTMAGSLAAGLILLGCAAAVQVDYDRDVSFAAFRTYAWMDSTGRRARREESPFFARRLRRAVEQALRARGFEPDSSGTPDLLVTAFLIGPTGPEPGWADWPAAPCGSTVSLGISFGYPYGYGLRHAHWPWRSPFYRAPWGYACGYRVGFGYLWIPVYEEPARRLGGTVVIDILDAARRVPIWRGAEEGVIRYAGESPSQEEMDGVAARILHDFPPRPAR